MGLKASKKCEYNRQVSQVTLTSYQSIDNENESWSSDATDHSSTHVEAHAFTVQSVSCYEETSNENEGRNYVYKRSTSEMSVTCYKENSGDNMEPSLDTSHDNNNQHDTTPKYRRAMSQITITCYEETDNKNGVTKRAYSRTVSQISVTYREIKNNNNRQGKSGKRMEKRSQKDRRTTLIPTQDGTIEVHRPAKEIAKYCLPLLTAHFAGQTTSSIHTDICEEENGSLHLGVYLRLMDAYLRHFETTDEFTGTEEFYLKVLSYIAKKRRLPTGTEDECYQRLLRDSKRFVQIYHKRGGFSQEIKEHKNYWGSRQQLLSGKVIADWVDKENGPIDPIFGVLLQPTTGRAGPGDAGLFHQVMFDDNGHVAYHSAVHDAFGYLINYHDTGPGYDYLHESKFGAANPLAGQIDGMSFWKNVLKSEELKPHVMALTTGALGMLTILKHQVKNIVFL